MRIIVADDEYFARKALVINIGQLDSGYGTVGRPWSGFGGNRY